MSDEKITCPYCKKEMFYSDELTICPFCKRNIAYLVHKKTEYSKPFSTNTYDVNYGIDRMYSEVGEKIQLIARIQLWLGGAVTVIAGILLMILGGKLNSMHQNGNAFFWGGIAALILGPFGSWVSSLFLYGFGIIVKSKE